MPAGQGTDEKKTGGRKELGDSGCVWVRLKQHRHRNQPFFSFGGPADWNRLGVELWTHARGGLTENDFIVAARLDAVDTEGLLRRKKPDTPGARRKI